MDKIRKFDSTELPRSKRPTQLCIPEVPLDIEIGCGVGLHPLDYAVRNPDRYLVAIEHTKERFRKFRNRLQEHTPIPNLLAIHANAISWITELVPEGRVSRIFLLYPNPWPKKKQRNQRWHAMPFMEQLIASLTPGGDITIVTNEKFYYEEARLYLKEQWDLEKIKDCKYNEASLPENFPRTHFEKKYIESGQDCWEICFKKESTEK